MVFITRTRCCIEAKLVNINIWFSNPLTVFHIITGIVAQTISIHLRHADGEGDEGGGEGDEGGGSRTTLSRKSTLMVDHSSTCQPDQK